jgi:6-phosphogluconolactonase
MRIRLILMMLFAILCWQPAQAASSPDGFVYIATNDPKGNAVIQFSRAADGTLTKINQLATGGLGGVGNGVGDVDPLGSQDALVLSGDGSILLIVNAGSNELSLLRVGADGLSLLSTVRSGGRFPNSVAMHGNLIYVLNARGTPNVSGFRISFFGKLIPIEGSTRVLPGGKGAVPHDVRFSPDGTRLLVTEEGTNQIAIFEVANNGLLRDPETEPSEGTAPFGFTFARGDTLLVTEAVTSSLSWYKLTAANKLNVISSAVPNNQVAACWISLTRNGRIGFVSNTGSSTISSYRVNDDGSLSLVKPVAARIKGGAPIDSALSRDSEFLYVIDSALGRIFSYEVNGAGLKLRERITGLPKTIQGIAAQ